MFPVNDITAVDYLTTLPYIDTARVGRPRHLCWQRPHHQGHTDGSPHQGYSDSQRGAEWSQVDEIQYGFTQLKV